jgi:hypothetical protein
MLYCLQGANSPNTLVCNDFVRQLTDIENWGGLHSFPDVESEYKKANTAYDKEIKMTGARRLLYGTESKPSGLFLSNQPVFERLCDFLYACEIRLRVRWGLIPNDWYDLQVSALRQRLQLDKDIELPKDAATYFFCPQCAAIRSVPVEFPDGQNPVNQNPAMYSKEIRLDIHSMRHYCSTKINIRRKGSIMRRRLRNARKNKKELIHEDGSDIEVCDGTPLEHIDMLGVALFTRTDGLLLLCVDCACLLRFTPECITPEGPSCGCRLRKQLQTSPKIQCGICERQVDETTTRQLRVLGEDGIEDIHVCRTHYTKYARDPGYIFPLKTVKDVIKKKLFVRMVNGVPYFHKRKN